MRRNQIFSFFGSVLLMMTVASCGFTPVYAPGSATARALSTIELAEPNNQNQYLFVRAMEDRLGLPSDADKILSYKLSVSQEGVESDTDRRRVVGVVTYRLAGKGSKKLLASGSVDSFTGYSVSDGLFAGARQDAIERLIEILADQLTRDLMVKLAAS